MANLWQDICLVFSSTNKPNYLLFVPHSCALLQFVPHDTAKLIELQGGNESFVNRLDFIFNEGYFDVTDEPSMEIPFMYHYANLPGVSTQKSRQIIAESFNTTISGLPGNDGKFIPFRWVAIHELWWTLASLVDSGLISLHSIFWSPSHIEYRSRCHGSLFCILFVGNVSCASHSSISTFFAVLLFGLVLQPRVQQYYYH